ncbi:MAG: putative transposase [Haloquadratum walsbyi J07HQW2]|uniref:Putative transposase n=1 Tax=Haloquadratum walsbyi J07HQW2 TaxID=1238425 RepID=U1NBR9_9EURY|nr:MAG: putative transposase [Haloquadratum walsbyi J07HQW2]
MATNGSPSTPRSGASQKVPSVRDGDGDYFLLPALHIGFRRPKTKTKTDTEKHTAEDGTVLGVGVDLGIENLAVTSTASFVSGQELTQNLRECEKVRAGLRQTGTRSDHRPIEQSSGRELRYVLHRASNAIRLWMKQSNPIRYDCDVIAFEDLIHIRDRDRTGASWGHKWAF